MEINTAVVTKHSPAPKTDESDIDVLAWILNRLLGQIPVNSRNISAWNDLIGIVVPAYQALPNNDGSIADELLILEAFEKEWAGREVGATYQKTVRKLEDLFPFSTLEAGILATVYYCQKNKKLCELLDGKSGSDMLVKLSRIILGVEDKDASNAVGENGCLSSLGFIESSDRADFPVLNPILRDYIENTDQALLKTRLYSPLLASEGSRIPAACDSVTDSEKTLRFLLETRTAAIARIANPHDTDAVAEWLYALGGEYGRSCRLHVAVKNWMIPENTHSGLVEMLMAWRLVEAEGGLLIVNEDPVITGSFHKMTDWQRKNFKRFSGKTTPVFWILPDDPELEIPDSLLFDYTIDLTATLKARQSVTLPEEVRRAAELTRWGEEETARYVRQLGGQASDLAAVLPHLAASLPDSVQGRMPGYENRSASPDLFKTLLRSRIACRSGSGTEPVVNTPSTRYDASALNTDVPIGTLVSSLKKRAGSESDCALGILLWGPPGTGKTAFASYLAGKSNMELMVQRYSDLQDEHVSVGEKRVHEAFVEAQNGNKIFLLDEADSLLRDRGRAHQIWEVTMTNEILTSLDAFRGVFVACTNRLDDLDEAALRRFAWKIAFYPLKPERYPRMFRRYFPGRSLGGPAAESLAAVRNLTPGDFEAVRRKVTLYDRLPKTADLLDLLRSEASYRDRGSNRTVGF